MPIRRLRPPQAGASAAREAGRAGDAKLQSAERACHLSPTLLAAELEKFQRPAEVYIDHIKPGLEEAVMHEIERQVRNRRPHALKRSQVLEL